MNQSFPVLKTHLFNIAPAAVRLLLCRVPHLRKFAIYWVPVLFWMALIFSASSDRKSFQHSSLLIGPIVRWLFPQISDHALFLTILGIRKCAHMVEYSVLGLLIWRALRQPVRRDARPWQWSQFRLALLVVILYAATDEFHQTFVPSREGSVWDVLIDTVGATLGLVLLWAAGRWRRHW